MHHEHHGDCCLPHEPHDPALHAAAIVQLSRACCAGACNHMNHQPGIEHMLASQPVQPEALFDSIDKKTKKKKKKRLGGLGLFFAYEPARVMRPNLPQYN